MNARMHCIAAPWSRFKPWVAYRSFAGDAAPNPTANTDYYQEILLHLGLMPTDDFLFFNPCERPDDPKLCPVTPADNDVASATLLELSAAAGCTKSSRQWATQGTDALEWLASYLLTGTYTPEGAVWRFTPDLGAVGAHSSPSDYVSQGTTSGLLQITVFNPQDGSSTVTINIPDGKVWQPPGGGSAGADSWKVPQSVAGRRGRDAADDENLASSVSGAGLWIMQPKGAAPPTRFRTVAQPFLGAASNEL